MLHFVELPYKKIVTMYAGETKGPNTRAGALSRAISRMANDLKEMVDFETIPCDLIEVDPELLLNNDQKYAYNLWIGIVRGRAHLIEKYGLIPPLPAKPHNARWLPQALHTMRYYIQCPKPTVGLKRLVIATVKWYLPMFFLAKKKSHICEAARVFHQGIVWARQNLLASEIKKVKACFENNAFMAHPEAIMLAGIADSDQKIRVECAEIIIQARENHKNDAEIRKYEPPKGNLVWEAETYLDMVDLNDNDYVTPPPLLRNFDDESLRKYARDGNIPIPNIPSHSVNNERAIKNTSQASAVSVGEDKTHANILNLGESRERIPTRHKKSDFK